MTYFSHLLILKSSIDLSCNCGMIACDKNLSFHLRWEQQERWLSWQRKSKDKLSWGISEKWHPRPGTIGGTQDPRPSTLNVGPEPGTLKEDFQKIFSVFSEVWRLWINSCAFCICMFLITLSYGICTFNLLPS